MAVMTVMEEGGGIPQQLIPPPPPRSIAGVPSMRYTARVGDGGEGETDSWRTNGSRAMGFIEIAEGFGVPKVSI
ncbi:hypothetical protein BHE74_00037644 [Ensete ventricosum]|nr:hypothetical protein GW17_00033379 [Ensete ventricosum]RWW55689.1 hypothetical protein BHE74_00037644 [Ensete ventricosum]RZS13462.1 hypothetical protein BHM03_00045059 [Ensete ventricosum]